MDADQEWRCWLVMFCCASCWKVKDGWGECAQLLDDDDDGHSVRQYGMIWRRCCSSEILADTSRQWCLAGWSAWHGESVRWKLICIESVERSSTKMKTSAQMYHMWNIGSNDQTIYVVVNVLRELSTIIRDHISLFEKVWITMRKNRCYWFSQTLLSMEEK